MLKVEQLKRVVVVGSTSDIGLEILRVVPLHPDAEVLLMGRTCPSLEAIQMSLGHFEFHRCDLSIPNDLRIAADVLDKGSDIDLAIVVAGVLPREDDHFDLDAIEKAIAVNSLGSMMILSALAKKMHLQSAGRILYVSSVASMWPRKRNFTYGASKISADFFARGLSNKYKKSGLTISVLRPGFVFTKMTTNFRPAPFALTKEELSRIALSGVFRGKEVIYAPKKLKVIMGVLVRMPKWVINALSR